jgi:hypothetical protein
MAAQRAVSWPPNDQTESVKEQLRSAFRFTRRRRTSLRASAREIYSLFFAARHLESQARL